MCRTLVGDAVGPPSAGPADGVLHGVSVLDLTQYLAGPTCTRMLAELGADVLKVETTPFGDPSRAFPPRANHRSGFFVQQNRGKRSLCVDLGQADGVKIVKQLAAQCDVLVENFSPGVMARKGLDYESLATANPQLIMTSISGFGQTGPLSSKPAFDFIAQAYSGLMHMTGETDGPPLFVGTALADVNAGVHAFAAIGHALFRRERTGVGAYLDIAMVDCLVHMQEVGVCAPSIEPSYEPIRQGRYYQVAQPAAVYRGPSGWIVVICLQHQIHQLWRAMDRPELATDPRFTSNEARLRHRDELTELIEEWMGGYSTDAEVVARLEQHRVPCSPVNNPAALATDDHLRVRDAVRTVDDPRLGSVAMTGFPIQFGGPVPPRNRPDEMHAPNLGQHNREVLRERLGWSDGAVDDAERRKVLMSKDR